jgi:hypothetical protein
MTERAAGDAKERILMSLSLLSLCSLLAWGIPVSGDENGTLQYLMANAVAPVAKVLLSQGIKLGVLTTLITGQLEMAVLEAVAADSNAAFLVPVVWSLKEILPLLCSGSVLL